MSQGRYLLIVLAAAGALSGCGSLGRKAPPPPAPLPAPAEIPAPRPVPPVKPAPPPPVKSCVPKSLPSAPGYPDTDSALRAAGGAADRYQLLAAGRILRQRRLEDLERVILGCR